MTPPFSDPVPMKPTVFSQVGGLLPLGELTAFFPFSVPQTLFSCHPESPGAAESISSTPVPVRGRSRAAGLDTGLIRNHYSRCGPSPAYALTPLPAACVACAVDPAAAEEQRLGCLRQVSLAVGETAVQPTCSGRHGEDFDHPPASVPSHASLAISPPARGSLGIVDG